MNDPFSNKAFADKNMLNFPLISDYKREVIKLYDVELKDFAGLKGYTFAERSVFILDKMALLTTTGFQKTPEYSQTTKKSKRCGTKWPKTICEL